jgi:hypothetical protein
MRKSTIIGNLVSCVVESTIENGGGENNDYHSDGGLLKSPTKKVRSAGQRGREVDHPQ